jgi:hypothetical protein
LQNCDYELKKKLRVPTSDNKSEKKYDKNLRLDGRGMVASEGVERTRMSRRSSWAERGERALGWGWRSSWTGRGEGTGANLFVANFAAGRAKRGWVHLRLWKGRGALGHLGQHRGVGPLICTDSLLCLKSSELERSESKSSDLERFGIKQVRNQKGPQ